MLISRKSRRRSDRFQSRFAEGSPKFFVRQYMRCREDFFTGILQVVVLAAIMVAIFVLAVTLWQVFRTHGQDVSPWTARAIPVGVAGLGLLLLMRVIRRLRQLKEIRQEMRQLRQHIDDQLGERS
jgi:hypothetical protein